MNSAGALVAGDGMPVGEGALHVPYLGPPEGFGVYAHTLAVPLSYDVQM